MENFWLIQQDAVASTFSKLRFHCMYLECHPTAVLLQPLFGGTGGVTNRTEGEGRCFYWEKPSLIYGENSIILNSTPYVLNYEKAVLPSNTRCCRIDS